METATVFCLPIVILFVVQVYSYNQVCAPGTKNETVSIILTSTGVTYFTSLNYPNEYPGNLDYNWTIAMQGLSTQIHALILEVVFLEMEDRNSTCVNDKLSIYDNASSSNPVELCDHVLPNHVICIKGTATIRLQTDGTQCYKGFNISAQPDTTNICALNTSTTTTLTSTMSTSVIKTSTTSQSPTVRNSWPSSSTQSHINLSTSVPTFITQSLSGPPKTGADVGGVVGGLLAVALLVGLLVFLRHWLLKRRPASVEAEKEPTSEDIDDKTTSTLFSPTKLMREHTCAPAATFPVPRPLTAGPVHPRT